MKVFVTLIFLVPFIIFGQTKQRSSFKVVPLGILGGIDESNLSAYLIAPSGSDDYICLDAGTIYSGVMKSIKKKVFMASPENVIKKNIKAYFISHAHLDHVSGLIINSPNDSNKTVYAMENCMKMLQEYYFNGIAWANFGDQGKGLLIKKYHFQTMEAGKEINVANSSMGVTAFPLSHTKPFESAAFLVRHKDSYALYLGDTGSDTIEGSDKLYNLWESISPLIRSKKLKGIFIEVSFPNDQSNLQLYGHLKPSLLMDELGHLAKLTGEENLKGLNVIITHGKPPTNRIKQLQKEIRTSNKYHVNLIFPEQGKLILL